MHITCSLTKGDVVDTTKEGNAHMVVVRAVEVVLLLLVLRFDRSVGICSGKNQCHHKAISMLDQVRSRSTEALRVACGNVFKFDRKLYTLDVQDKADRTCKETYRTSTCHDAFRIECTRESTEMQPLVEQGGGGFLGQVIRSLDRHARQERQRRAKESCTCNVVEESAPRQDWAVLVHGGHCGFLGKHYGKGNQYAVTARSLAHRYDNDRREQRRRTDVAFERGLALMHRSLVEELHWDPDRIVVFSCAEEISLLSPSGGASYRVHSDFSGPCNNAHSLNSVLGGERDFCRRGSPSTSRFPCVERDDGDEMSWSPNTQCGCSRCNPQKKYIPSGERVFLYMRGHGGTIDLDRHSAPFDDIEEKLEENPKDKTDISRGSGGDSSTSNTGREQRSQTSQRGETNHETRESTEINGAVVHGIFDLVNNPDMYEDGMSDVQFLDESLKAHVQSGRVNTMLIDSCHSAAMVRGYMPEIYSSVGDTAMPGTLERRPLHIPSQGHKLSLDISSDHSKEGLLAITSSAAQCSAVRYGKYENPFTEAVLGEIAVLHKRSRQRETKTQPREQPRHVRRWRLRTATASILPEVARRRISIEEALRHYVTGNHRFPFAFGDAAAIRELSFRDALAAPYFFREGESTAEGGTRVRK